MGRALKSLCGYANITFYVLEVREMHEMPFEESGDMRYRKCYNNKKFLLRR